MVIRFIKAVVLLKNLIPGNTERAHTYLQRYWEEYIREQGGKELVFFTNSEKNIAFYKKLGFEVFDFRTIEYRGKTMGSWSVKKRL